ncbi:MAG TPA: FAD-linked oxidase C-terminal domain-containing protein [Candidatus Paceibacterota bacterium]|nr:FAD-linked oxidase C-terminal domain-containing protein [Candidatus Paceibacterota bacterium]
MDMHEAVNREIIDEVSDKVYDLVIQYHGSITAEHNDGIIRTPYLLKMFGADIIELFKKTKDIFDPQDIFNPGKKVPSADPTGMGNEGGTKKYMLEHISKK